MHSTTADRQLTMSSHIYQVDERFSGKDLLTSPALRTHVAGSAAIERTRDTVRLVNADTTARQTSNAQIDDYGELPRKWFLWRPPLTMTVRARFSHPASELSGTAGFGFWNDPFMMTGALPPARPRALWFLYASPPSDMPLALGVPGRGWKAAIIDASRPATLLWAPIAPLAVTLMNVRPIYRWLWPRIQRALCVAERALDVVMTTWHTYTIVWDRSGARFDVDGRTVLTSTDAPRGPLGFVMWLDNQYLAATPWGRFRYGRLEAPGRQWMEVDRLSIVPRTSCPWSVRTRCPGKRPIGAAQLPGQRDSSVRQTE